MLPLGCAQDFRQGGIPKHRGGMGMPPYLFHGARSGAFGFGGTVASFDRAQDADLVFAPKIERTPRSRPIHNNLFLWYHSQEFIGL